MELKNAFNGLLSMHGTAEQRIIVLECRSTEITQNEKARQKFKTEKSEKNKSCGTVSTSAIIIPEVILYMYNCNPIWKRQNATK